MLDDLHADDCPDHEQCDRVNGLLDRFIDLATSLYMACELDCDEDRITRWLAELEISHGKLSEDDKLLLMKGLIAPIAMARGDVQLGRVAGVV